MDVEGDLPVGDRLKGAQIRVQNDGARDACYTIEGVSQGPGGVLRVDVGDTSFIRGLVSTEDYSRGYVYNFAPGDAFEVQTAVYVRLGGGGIETVWATVDFAWP